MKATEPREYKVYVNGGIFSWEKPVPEAYLAWSAVYVPTEEVVKLAATLEKLHQEVSGDVQKFLARNMSGKTSRVVGRLSGLLGGMFHTVETRAVKKAESTVSLLETHFPLIVNQIEFQLKIAGAKGQIATSSFPTLVTRPTSTIPSIVQSAPWMKELILPDFATWSEIHYIHNESIRRYYQTEVLDFEKWMQAYPLLGAQHGLAKRLTVLIRKARSKSINSETWVRGRRWEGEVLTADQMDAPPPDKTFEGRYNHAGRSVLYLASDDATCGAELVSPYEARRIWFQDFTVSKKRVLDLAYFPDLEEPTRNSEIDLVLAALHAAVDRPMNRQGNWRPEYYVPRFVADLVRWRGYDGILYKSLKGAGVNLVLFDPAAGITPIGTPRIGIYSGVDNAGLLQLAEGKPNTAHLACPQCNVVSDPMYGRCLACDYDNPFYKDFDSEDLGTE